MKNNRVVHECRIIIDTIPQQLISWGTYFWTYPFSFFVTFFTIISDINTGEELAFWFLLVTIAHFAMLPFVVYGIPTMSYRKQFLLVALMGFTRGSVLTLLIPLFNLQVSTPFYYFFAQSTITIFYWFQAGAIFRSFMSTFRKEVKKFIEESVILHRNFIAPSRDESGSILLARISETQMKILKTLENNPTRENIKRRAADIDKLIREHIRPLSHSEWREGQLVWARPEPLKTLATSLRQNQLPIWGIVILTLPLTFLTGFSKYGFFGILILLSIRFVIIALIRKIAEKIFDASNGDFFKQNLFLLFEIVIFMAPMLLLPQIFWLNPNTDIANLIEIQMLSSITFLLFCLITSITLTLKEEEQEVFRILTRQLNESNPALFQDLSFKAASDIEYAQYLHAQVQSQLLACKLLLLKAAESEFELFPPEVTRQILDKLEKLNQPYERVPTSNPSERIEKLCISWKGLANIKYRFPPQIDDENMPKDIISQLIEESVINSIRHGKARNIEIRTDLKEEVLSFKILDDGTLKESTKSGGLGTILFNTFAADWSIRREGNTTILEFTIRVPQTRISQNP